jgi:predicted DsbA family dithiol-disulfide isomerase
VRALSKSFLFISDPQKLSHAVGWFGTASTFGSQFQSKATINSCLFASKFFAHHEYPTMNSTEIQKRVVRVDITSDLVCPWCWVGLRKLQEASNVLAPELDIEINWHPYMLRPNTPVEGTPKNDTPAKRVGSHLRVAGQSVGVDFTGLTDRVPNTALFHATVHHLQENAKKLNLSWDVITAFHESVFEGYFTLGIFPDEQGILQAAKSSIKYDKNDTAGASATNRIVVEAIESLYKDQYQLYKLKDFVKEEALIASYHKDIRGVPTFAFNGEIAFSGAQPVPAFMEALRAAAANARMDN